MLSGATTGAFTVEKFVLFGRLSPEKCEFLDSERTVKAWVPACGVCVVR